MALKLPAKAAPLLVFAASAAFFAALNLVPAGLTERDGYFHARLAQMLPERGLSRSFPWMQASTLRDRFWDKEFLYHALMCPFARGEDPVRGAIVFSALLSACVFLAFHLLLRAHRVRWPLLFTLVLAAMGGTFLLRISFIRSHVLSVLLMLLGLHLCLRGNWKALVFLGFAYSWSYSFPLILPAVILAMSLGRWVGKGGADWKSPVAALGGVFLGLVIHPYFPNSLEGISTYLQVLRLALAGRSLSLVEVGKEFAPFSTRSFLLAYPLMTALVLGLGLTGWRSSRRASPETMGLLLTAACAFVGTMVFVRFIEYAAPIVAAAAAFTVRDCLAGRETGLSRWSAARPAAAWALTLCLALCLVGLTARGAAHAFHMAADNDPPRFRNAARWMAERLDPGETVVNLWWDDFPELFYDGSRQRYVVGLDPTYMLRFDAEKAALLEGMRMARLPIDAQALADSFGARYMILRTPNARFYPQLISGAWEPVYHDNQAAIFALTGPFGPRTP
ncbi:MAG: hypothetical protein WC728_08570 [Elusimicrobiota bacterium]